MTAIRSVFRYDPSGRRPVGALLRVTGLVLAAYGGERIGGHGAAVLAAIGALYAGIASFGGVHGTRLRRMFAATTAAGFTTFLGCLIQPSNLGAFVGVTLGTFFLAVLAGVGPDAAQVSLLATGLLVVFSGLPGASTHPLGNALLVLGGGLAQAAILMAVHPISPVSAERRAVESVYRGLASFARHRAEGRLGLSLPNVAVHAAARDLLIEGFRYGNESEQLKLWSELELADALRGNLAGLDRVGASSDTWTALADWLGEAGESAGRGRPIRRTPPPLDSLSITEPWVRRICRAIAVEQSGTFPTVLPARVQPSVIFSIESLRALALGHALRYAVAVGVAVAAYRWGNADHGYWAPLATAFSLKPDFASTVAKGGGRIVGTLGGVALSTFFVAGFHPSAAGLTVALVVSTWVAFTLMNAWFVGYSAALAFWVVVAVTLAGASATTVGAERLELTAAGSLFALGMVVLWPKWESAKARTSLAVAFAEQAAYAEAVAAFESREAVSRARYRSRAARLEAERVFAAAELEPAWGQGRQLRGVEAAHARLEENAARILAAHVAGLDPHEDDEAEDLGRLAADNRSVAADLMG